MAQNPGPVNMDFWSEALLVIAVSTRTFQHLSATVLRAELFGSDLSNFVRIKSW